DPVGAEQGYSEMARAAAGRPHGDALATQLVQAVDGLVAAIKDPQGLDEGPAEGDDLRGALAVGDPSLEESDADVGIRLLQQRDVFAGAPGGSNLDRDAIALQQLGITPAEREIGAGRTARGDDDPLRRRRLGELQG